MTEQIYVTRPSLPPLSEFIPYLETIWRTGVLTHNGPYLHQLERELCDFLRINDIACLANGTCALQLAIRALDLTGEIITTPFTFIATANIIKWESCRPVFVDIDPYTWNMDPNLIESAITPRTSAVLPVHVFSCPCDVEAIEFIAKKNDLKVIYDAAHAMAVDFKGQSLLRFGDISCLSFHATKLFNTVEGGACVSASPDVMARIRRMRFFGFNEHKDVTDLGMNAKMTEVSAALGIANLKHVRNSIAVRKALYATYVDLLSDCDYLSFQKFDPESYNYSYMPILFDTEERCLDVFDRLHSNSIFSRRYFHPSLNILSLFGQDGRTPISEEVSRRILCLPLFESLTEETVHRICNIVKTI